MRRHDPTTERWASLPLFATCDRRELRLVARTFTRRRFGVGDVLVRERRVGREFIVIVEGTADVVVDGRLVARLRSGDFVGEVALLDRRCRTATVVASSDIVAEVCSTPEFNELVADAPHVTSKLLAGLAGRLRAADAALTG